MTQEEATKFLFNRTPADRIIEAHQFGDFWEFTVRAGGDGLVYRIYDNGEIYSR